MNEREYIGTELRTELISTILPPKLICLFPHKFNFLRRLKITGSHVEILLGFAPTGSPRYLKGRLPLMQLRKEHATSIKVSLTLTPTRQLFKKLTLRPEANSKPLRIAFKV
jgi:hypothetical protein